MENNCIVVTAPLPFSGTLPGWQSSFVSGSVQNQPFFLISPLRGVSAPPPECEEGECLG